MQAVKATAARLFSPICLLACIFGAGVACKSWGQFWQTAIQYPNNLLLVTQNVAMTAATPTMPGAAKSCSISPALPEGLSLASDCTISGTPTRGQGAIPYKVTADIGSDTVSGELRIRVLFQPRFVYVANALSDNLTAFSLAPSSGSLTSLGNFSTGTSSQPKYVAIHPSGKFLYVANWGNAGIAAFSINQLSGSLVSILGSPFATAQRPYSLAIDPQGIYLYVGHEEVSVQAVSAYAINPNTGALTQISGSPFFVASGSSPLSVGLSFDGAFLYVGSSQNATNAHVFRVDQTSGALAQISGSPFTPINNAISVFVQPSGRYVYYAQYTSGVVGLSRDGASGALSLLAGSPFATGGSPTFVTGDIASRFLYVCNSADSSISGYQVNAASGELTPISGSPFSAGSGSIGFVVDETGRFAYSANGGANNLSGYTIDASTGQLSATPGSPYATATSPYNAAIAGSNP